MERVAPTEPRGLLARRGVLLIVAATLVTGVLAAPTRGSGAMRSRSTPTMLLIVLMSERPSQPPFTAA